MDKRKKYGIEIGLELAGVGKGIHGKLRMHIWSLELLQRSWTTGNGWKKSTRLNNGR